MYPFQWRRSPPRRETLTVDFSDYIDERVTVLAKSSNYFFIRSSFFCIDILKIYAILTITTLKCKLPLLLPPKALSPLMRPPKPSEPTTQNIHFISFSILIIKSNRFEYHYYNQMRKKDSHQPQHNQSNSKLFIITSAFKNYERDRIDSTAVHNFNSLLHTITLRILKAPQEPDVAELFSITNQIIIGFLANLSEQTYRHTCTQEDIINFFVVMATYFEKSITGLGVNEIVLQSNILGIFFPIIGKPVEGAKGIQQSKVQIINNLIQGIEEPKQQKINYGVFARECFTIMGQLGQKELSVREILIAFLRNSSVVSNFKPALIKYLTTTIAESRQQLFKKALLIYEHIGSTFEERRMSLENMLLKALEYKNCISNLSSIISCMGLTKLVNPVNLPEVIMRITEKLFSKDNTSGSCLNILEQLSQISFYELMDVNCEKLFKGEHVIIRFLEWVLARYLKKDQSDNSLDNQAMLLEKGFEDHSLDMKEEKFLQFVKKLSNKNSCESDESKIAQLKKVCSCFSIFIQNMCRHPLFREKLAIKDIDSLCILKSTQRLSHQTLRTLILTVIPPLLTNLTFNFKDRAPLKYAITLKAAELSAEKHSQGASSLTSQFKEIYFQMLQSESLNYHYVLCFLFLKYQKDREGIRQLILDAMTGELLKQQRNKNSRNLILNLSLLLKSYDNMLLSLPIKYKVRQLSKNIDQLAEKLDINQLLSVQPKEYTNLRHDHIEFDAKMFNLKRVINRQLSNFDCKEHLNLLYSLTIAINDLIELPQDEEVQHSLLTQITTLRKRAMLGETYTVINLINEAIKEVQTNYSFTHPKKIEIFLLLLRLQHLSRLSPLKLNEDSEELFTLLSDLLVIINSSFNNQQLENLSNFRSSPNNYSYERFQGYIEERQIIKFYSQSSKNAYETHIMLCRVGLAILNKLMEIKDIQVSALPARLQVLQLLYSAGNNLFEASFTPNYDEKIKIYIMVLLLQEKIRNGLTLEPLLKKLTPNANLIKDIVLKKHALQPIAQLQELYPVAFSDICLTAVRRILQTEDKDSQALFGLVTKVIEEDDKECGSLSSSISTALENELAAVVCKEILDRTKRGLELQKKDDFQEESASLYKLISRAVEKDKKHLLGLVEDLIQVDCYESPEQSAFILKEISSIFRYIEERNSEICEVIFNYIVTLTEIFVGDEKLEISTFICNFFGLHLNQHQDLNLNALQKTEKLACGYSPNYKCLQCDEKKIICLGCSITCHSNHPVCFLNIPPELKFAKCQCSELGCNSCKLGKENPQGLFQRPKDFPLHKGLGEGLMGPPPEIYERMKVLGNPFPSRYSRQSSIQSQDRYDSMHRFEIQSLIREEQLIEQEMRANQWYQNIRRGPRGRDREEQLSRIGVGRIQRIMDREDHPASYRMFIEANQPRRPSRFPPHIEKDKEKEEPRENNEPEFVDEDYEQEMQEHMQAVGVQSEQGSTILKKYVLLPKFIDLMVNFCNKKSDKSKALTNVDRWGLNFVSSQAYKLPQGNAFRIHNSGSFTFEIRRENAINNMSCVLIKKNVASNNKYLLLASSTEISVFSLEKVLMCVSEMKTMPGYNAHSRHSLSFEVHSLDFSPIDKSLFCASGLHNLALLNINNEGQISRTSFRYNVSNFYINKIKLTKMGIFVGIDKEIRVLNYSCRNFLTLRAHQSNTMIREWSVFQKAAGCQVLFVCPNGNIFTTDVLASDQDKKEFVAKITDHRANKTGVGVSIATKDIPDFGKYLFAAFKDGSNILGRLESDQLEDMVNMQLKGLKYEKNIFDSNFIIGHAEIVKMPQTEELYLICTVKKYFPPDMSFHQGILVAIRFKKVADKNQSTSQIVVLNDEMTCEFFRVIKVGKKHFFIYSVHTDGSVQITTLGRIPRLVIDEELTCIRQNSQNDSPLDNQDNKQTQSLAVLRKTLSRQINLESLNSKVGFASSYSFRDGSEGLKSGSDYSLIKHSQTEYEFKYNNFSKILTGFSVPFFGQVVLPTRKITATFEVGLTQLEALSYFGEGSFKFRYKKSDENRYTRQAYCNPSAHPRMLERIQRIQRLSEYHDGDKLINNHLMSSILGFKEDSNTEIQFVGKSFETFKAKVPKFDELFKSEGDDETSSIEKTALIIKMFLTKSLKEGNPCSDDELLQLITGIKSIIAASSKRLFVLLKEIIMLASQVYQKQTGRQFAVVDDNYSLRVATESRVQHYFSILKVDISDNQLNEFLAFLTEILEEDPDLMALYVSKYSGILTQLHRRLKKVDTEPRAKALIQLYTFAYPILKFCSIPCAWVLTSICNITYSYYSSKALRDTLYQTIKRTKQISFQEWLKNVCSAEGVVEEIEALNSNRSKGEVEEPKDQMMEIYNMLNRGQIDQETMFKMIAEASKLEYQRQQQNQMVVEEECEQIQPQLQKEMEVEENVINHNIALVQDLTDECTGSFSESVQVTYSRIMTLYVLSKAIDNCFEEATNHLLKRIKKMVQEIDLKAEGQRLQAVLCYSSLFNRIFNNSCYLKNNHGKQHPLYLELEEEVNEKLAKIRLESVPKITKQPNLLGHIFRDDKSPVNIHVAYALTSLLLFPCQASHVLLSLECYWLLPESKEFYSKKKDFSNITDGIESGNIQKVYETAKQNPEIWQEYNNIFNKLGLVEKWIDEKRSNWELALELIAIYYQD